MLCATGFCLRLVVTLAESEGFAEEAQLLQTHWKGSSMWDSLGTREVFADASLYQVMSSCDGHGISRECWASKFASFDRNSDGIISAEDLQSDAKQWRAVQNFTRQEVRAGLALAAEWFPHEASRLIMHAPFITELILQNDLDNPELDKVPAPQDHLPKLKHALITPIPLTGGDNSTMAGDNSTVGGDNSTMGDDHSTLIPAECVGGVVKVAVSSLSLMFGILHLATPSETFIADLIQKSKSAVVERILSILHDGNSDSSVRIENIENIALKVWRVFDILHEEGLFSQILEYTLKNLSWWKASLVIVRAAATLASWYASGTVLLLLQIGLAVPNAADLISGLKEVHAECHLPV